MDYQEQARVRRARRALSEALDEVDQTFHPRHLGKMVSWSLKRSLRKNTVAWGVAGGVVAAIALGLAIWALVSGDDDEV